MGTFGGFGRGRGEDGENDGFFGGWFKVSLGERGHRGSGGVRGSGEGRNDGRERERESGKRERKGLGLGLGLWVWGLLGGFLGWERGVWVVGIHGERAREEVEKVCYVLSLRLGRFGFGWWRWCGLSD